MQIDQNGWIQNDWIRLVRTCREHNVIGPDITVRHGCERRILVHLGAVALITAHFQVGKHASTEIIVETIDAHDAITYGLWQRRCIHSRLSDILYARKMSSIANK